MMTRQEITQIITVARRAPLANMREAEIVAELLNKLASEYDKEPPAPAPAPEEPSAPTSEVADTSGK